MFVYQDYIIGFRDINKNYELTDKALLGFFEDTAGKHSSLVGYGILDIIKTNITWFLISIKVEIYNRPKYNEKVTIRTWCTDRNGIYSIRNYEAINEKGEVFAKASSKWVAINTENRSIIRLDDSINNQYEPENILNFEDEKDYKIGEPLNYDISKEYKVRKSMIDINNHVHNTYYLEFLEEVVPEDILENDLKEFIISYKSQIFYGDNIKVLYGKEEGYNYVTIKNNDTNKTNAVIRFK